MKQRAPHPRDARHTAEVTKCSVSVETKSYPGETEAGIKFQGRGPTWQTRLVNVTCPLGSGKHPSAFFGRAESFPPLIPMPRNIIKIDLKFKF